MSWWLKGKGFPSFLRVGNLKRVAVIKSHFWILTDKFRPVTRPLRYGCNYWLTADCPIKWYESNWGLPIIKNKFITLDLVEDYSIWTNYKKIRKNHLATNVLPLQVHLFFLFVYLSSLEDIKAIIPQNTLPSNATWTLTTNYKNWSTQFMRRNRLLKHFFFWKYSKFVRLSN